MFRNLVNLDEAKRILKENFSAKPVGVDRVLLSNAHDRVLSEDIVALIDVPSFDRATVDGYAVRAADTFGADESKPVALRFCGNIPVGGPPKIILKKRTAAEIATGAPLPHGADAAVMIEYTSRKGNIVSIHRPVSKGENVMKAGSDIRKGETVLGKGEVISSRKIGVLAAVGLTEVKAYKRPTVAVVSTGTEIVEPGKPLPSGKIYDINAYTLSAAVLECGGVPINLGVVSDEISQLKLMLEKALNSADIVITSGGVSVGPKDIVPQVLDALGKPGVVVHGIAVKPGKPATIAIINGKPVFSLPGHPTSSLLMFHIMVRSLICGMAGRTEEHFVTLNAGAATKMFSARGRRTFVMVELIRDESGRLLASPVPPGLSGAITTLTRAEGFVEIHEKQQFVDEGDDVTVYLFKARKSDMSS